MGPTRIPRLHPALALAALAMLGGCASTRLDAQWADPQRSAHPLRGARVLIACEAYEQVLQRLCLDQLSAEVVARGATPVIGPDTTNPSPGRPLGDQQYLGAARSAGARAMLTSVLTPAAVNVNPGLSVGIGGMRIGSGGFGAGVGVSLPVGGTQMHTGYSSNTRVTDVASGRLMWTAKATAPPSSDINAQLSELNKAVFGAADKANLF